MKQKLLSETYRRLFKGRVGSNDSGLLNETLSSSQKEDLIDLVQIIYTNSSEGKDATEWIDDKLDEYANIITSSDRALYNAFHKLRLMADERPTAQAEAALELINVLNDKSKNDYLKQNNLYLDEFATLDEHDYETLVRLMRQFDKMIEADDDLFEFTNDFIDSKTYESGAYLERYFNEIYTYGEDMFPEAAEIAHHIEKLVHKAWSGDDYKSTF